MHFSLHPGKIIGQIDIPRTDEGTGRESDLPQPARAAQGNPAGCLRLEPAARGLSAPDSTFFATGSTRSRPFIFRNSRLTRFRRPTDEHPCGPASDRTDPELLRPGQA